jgi:hypothetical protein
MYTSVNFTTKVEFRRAVKAGLPITLYSPALGCPAVRGRAQAEGPWPGTVGVRRWRCQVQVKDMRVVAVLR